MIFLFKMALTPHFKTVELEHTVKIFNLLCMR